MMAPVFHLGVLHDVGGGVALYARFSLDDFELDEVFGLDGEGVAIEEFHRDDVVFLDIFERVLYLVVREHRLIVFLDP